MYLFYKLIRKLKDPKLNKQTWNLVADVFSSLTKKNIATFKEEFFKNHPLSTDVTEFMESWFQLIQELNDLNSYFPARLTNDDKLLILSEILPTDVEFLRLIAEKIEWLSRVSMKETETNNLLRLFLSAVAYRTQRLEAQPVTPREFSIARAEVENIAQTICMRLLTKKLLILCTNYLNSIAKNIELYLQANDPFQLCLRYYYLTPDMNIHTLIKEEANAINFHAPHANLTEMFKLLIIKYIQVDELICILGGDIKYIDGDAIAIKKNVPFEERLTVFANSFKDFMSKFKERINIHAANASFFSAAKSYTDEAVEDEFIATCDEITKQLCRTTPINKF